MLFPLFIAQLWTTLCSIFYVHRGLKMAFLLENNSSGEAQSIAGETITSFTHRYLNHPPPEILIKIFRYSLPSSAFLDGSLINVDEPICREEYHIKRNIVAVCRLWWNVGISMLYEEVVIRRIESLSAFSRTLVASSSHVGTFVKKLMVSCFVPFADSTTFQDTISRIIGRCPSLALLLINPSFLSAGAAQMGLWPTDAHRRGLHFCYQPLDITHLDWGSNLALVDLVHFLEHCSNLRSLRFHLHTDKNPDRFDVESALQTSVVLPNLQELYFCSDGMLNYFGYLRFHTIRWAMPKLERVTYVHTTSHSYPDGVSIFRQTHRQSFRYLHLVLIWENRMLNLLQDIVNECPSLVHLVCAPDSLDVIYSLSHTNIMWLDLWSNIPNNQQILMELVHARLVNLPSLRRIRILDSSLWCPGITELPILLPPKTAALDDGGEYMLCGMEIQQKGHFVFKKDLAVNFAPWLLGITNDNDGDGSDYGT